MTTEIKQFSTTFDALKTIEDDNVLQKEGQRFIEILVAHLIRTSDDVMGTSRGGDTAFWGYVFNRVQKRCDLTLSAPMAVSYASNRFTLRFNPKHCMNYTFTEVRAILVHEGFHLLMNHLSLYKGAMQSGKGQLVNIATDCEINQHIPGLPADGVTLQYVADLCGIPLTKVKPKEGSFYYLKLLNDNNVQPNNGNGNGSGDGQSIDDHEGWGGEQGDDSFMSPEEAARKLVDMARQDVKRNAAGRGTMSADFEQIIEKLFTSKQVPWQTLLRRSFGKIKKGKRPSINRLNRRLPHMLHKKGLVNDYTTPVVCAFDVSGSVTDKELQVYFSEVYNLSQKFNTVVDLIIFDSSVKSVKRVVSKHDFDYKVTGRGGTAFQPVFDYVKQNGYDKSTSIFIFSDGGGESVINTHAYTNYNWVLSEDYLSVKGDKRPRINVSISK